MKETAIAIGMGIGAAIGGFVAVIGMLLISGGLFALPFVAAYYVFRWLTGT